MKQEKDDILRQKQSHLAFTFQHQNDNLLIKAHCDGSSYCGILQPNPLITFDKIKKVLAVQNYQLVSKTNTEIQLTIASVIDLKLKSQDQHTLQFLKDTIHKLTLKVENQTQNNLQLAERLKNIEKSNLEMTKKLQHQISSMKTTFDEQINDKNQKMTQFKEENKNQDKLIANIMQELLSIKEDSKLQKEKNEKRYQEKALAYRKLKEVTQLQSEKIKILENNQISLQNQLQHEKQKNIDFTPQLTQLKTTVYQLHIQTLHNSSIIEETEFMKLSRVVCTPEEKSNIMKFFTKSIKQVKLLYRASDNDFDVRKFHKKCDGVANTLTVVWTEFDKKIGGFTPLKWSSPQNAGWEADNSKESFIFSLTHNDKFTLKSPENAICNKKSFGPAFGRGCDMIVQGNKDPDNSWTCLLWSYQNQKYKKDNNASWERFSGATKSHHFKIKEWEVWEVEWA